MAVMGTWLWALTKPGMSTLPRPSICSSKEPQGRWVLTERIFVPSTTT